MQKETVMYTKTEQRLTRLLMIELLAHQFCFPVQWIETQDAILRDFASERLIEIGPAETLTNMLKKTLKAGDYEISDIASGIQRHLMSFKRDQDGIYYRYPSEDDAEGSPEQAESQSDPAPTEKKTSAEVNRNVASSRSLPPRKVPVPDVPIEATNIVTAVVAMGLHKLPDDIDQNQSIKALSGGRSTVQNELVGDAIEEFGRLPDQPEDMALAELSQAISSSGLGKKLGPYTSKIISRMVSTKFPAGFGVSASRQYLQDTQSLQQGLQDRTLLLASLQPPAARLTSEKDAHAYLDQITRQVLTDLGVDLDLTSSEEEEPSGTTVVSSEAVDALEKQQKDRDLDILKVLAKRVDQTVSDSNNKDPAMTALVEELQARIDSWSVEHGEVYERGIRPIFEKQKARRYDSFWNWSIQDLLRLHADAVSGEMDALTLQAGDGHGALSRRVTEQLLDVVQHLLNTNADIADGTARQEIRTWLLDLQSACKHSGRPRINYCATSVVPILEIDDKGAVSVSCVKRELSDRLPDIDSPHLDGASELSWAEHSSASESSDSDPVFSTNHTGTQASSNDSMSSLDEPVGNEMPKSPVPLREWVPKVQLKGRSGWHTNESATNAYESCMQQATHDGVTFSGKQVVITGAGRDSIGAEIVRLCISSGASVLVTTSSYSPENLHYYRKIYQSYGAHESELTVVPWNGGSDQDVRSLVEYIYNDLQWDPDHIIPFAAVGEAGHGIDEISDRSELAHRVMLTNVLRLLGYVKREKAERRIETHPTHVVLPLSPNHGSFGRDGLYAESKLGLEALLHKWSSEGWQDYLSLSGADIGWTRGTGLMSANDILATGLEKDVGIRTFSATEMAWHLLLAMSDSMVDLCEEQPLRIDLTGGLSAHMDLKPVLEKIKADIDSQVDVRKALHNEIQEDGRDASVAPPVRLAVKASIQNDDMDFPEWSEMQKLAGQLDGMVDLERVVVVVGFGEAGPCGSSRTRWEAECSSTFSVQGCLELAWLMGLIAYHNGPLQGEDYCGWIDVESKEPVADEDVKARYEDYIIQHSGIRIVEQHDHDMTTPDKQQVLCEVAVEEDLEPFEASRSIAEDLQREHGKNNVVVGSETAEGQVMVTLRAGTTLYVPRAARIGRAVGAQMPSGWSARRYGIPEDIIAQVDQTTLYALVATVEALLSAGIVDAFEMFDHIHVGQLGNAIGSGLGGQTSSYAMFKQRFLGRQVQKDVLAETFLNTTAAWVNMLLCGASGPIRTPVGACATGLESIETGCELIQSGRSKAVLVGGVDSLERDIAHEFANMHATVDANADAQAGREPREASRPTTSTRGGFVEGEGCGVQLITTAQLALDMGLPIKAIIALTHMAADKIGRSVPAPGRGLLTVASEQRNRIPSPLLSLDYRRRQVQHRLQEIEEYRVAEHSWLDEQQPNVQTTETDRISESEGMHTQDSLTASRAQIDAEARRSIRDTRYRYGNGFWRDEASISPLRGALAVWGLTVDDLQVASLHGTSTLMNDVNETAVLQSQLEWLGRKKGNVLPCVSQKSIVGHGKGAAGAFALNGCLQCLRSGVIPGNRNADNVDVKLRDRHLLFFPSESYHACGAIKAFSVTSFGFGQKGAQVVGVNPRYLLATIGQQAYEEYRVKVRTRELKATRRLQSGMMHGDLVRVKEGNVYADDAVESSLLNR